MAELSTKEGKPFNAPHPTQHPHTIRCGLCDQYFAVTNSTWHISNSYRVYFCRECTDIMMKIKDRVRIAMRESQK